MTDQTNADLIAEAATRAELCDADSREAMRDTGRILLRLADALEDTDQLAETREETIRTYERENADWERRVHIAERKAAGFAAVVENALSPKNIDYGHVDIAIERVREALATAPADALREHDAALIEGLADEIAVETDSDAPDDFLRGFDAGSDAVYAALREKARQRREEKP